MASRPVPESVTRRKRIILFTDISLAVIILSIALHVTVPGISYLMWMIGAIAAAGGTLALRRTIDQADLPTTELDEYRLKLHLEAREDGLLGALALSILLFVVAGAIAFALRFWVWDGPTVALLFAKMAHLQLVWVPFIVARSLAGKFNRDELVSAR
ncbi:hypothetical protein G7Y29_07545 [Corynebacterium qintianiae]|uniref:Uncharacterized protein n=1 Tax=Corynebacterium qintianiae TaxID=2709392 RepID=A0A7T0KME8_9CORY|nr:hypothetical protein [Corynebacterium qintianiae]QPK82729.1 hypothetical protein G7Y29_07545 [Corynebacterium qintianiae]